MKEEVRNEMRTITIIHVYNDIANLNRLVNCEVEQTC